MTSGPRRPWGWTLRPEYAGRIRAAVEHLRALGAAKPDWMVVHILLGKSLLALGARGQARPVLQTAHRLAVAQHHDGPREELEELLQTL